MTENTDPANILVVEDDRSIAAHLVGGLRNAGFEVELCTDGEQAKTKMATQTFKLVVLDLMLPDVHGFELLESWRDRTSTPVIVLTASNSLPSRLKAFDLGAVDWMPKPFFLEELVARIRTRLQLIHDQPRRVLEWDGFRLDLDAREVSIDGEPAGLTSNEFNVLSALMTRPGRALSRRQLSESALPDDPADERNERVVDTHVGRIRKKLGSYGYVLKTVWGVGYRFDRAESDAS